jgi:predicted RNA binding protein YcfA (HicA-like mRNA interferase family)
MSRRWRQATSSDLIRVARKLGFEKDRQKGSHAVYYRQADGARVVIPVHKGKAIKPKTLAAIISDLGLTHTEFEQML